jgi:hypothetical protein
VFIDTVSVMEGKRPGHEDDTKGVGLDLLGDDAAAKRAAPMTAAPVAEMRKAFRCRPEKSIFSRHSSSQKDEP